MNLNKQLPSNIVRKIQFKNSLKLQLQINIVNNNLWNILSLHCMHKVRCSKCCSADNVTYRYVILAVTVMICTVHEMAWITNTCQSQTSSEENSNQRMGQTYQRWGHVSQIADFNWSWIFGTCHWFKLTIRHIPPLLTGVAMWLWH
jgi:hypothetical protein